MQPLTVFVVDDHEIVRKALGTFLHISGFQVKTFASAEECIRDLEKERADCILSDLDMPGMSGAQFAEELARRGCGVPIIILTSHPMEHPLVARARAAGVHAVLQKDFADGKIKDALGVALTAMTMPKPGDKPRPSGTGLR